MENLFFFDKGYSELLLTFKNNLKRKCDQDKKLFYHLRGHDN